MRNSSIGIILLAAGASTRLGEPKQLLKFQNETLLRRTAKIALDVTNRVIVTLGFRLEIMRQEVADLPVEIVENADWINGMSGSIRIGLEKLLGDADNLSAVIVMVCDQPFVSRKTLEELIIKFRETDALVVACAYQNTLGVPALFHRNLFPELFALDAQTGAKQLIKKYESQSAAILFPDAAFDVDTRADYERLVGKL